LSLSADNSYLVGSGNSKGGNGVVSAAGFVVVAVVVILVIVVVDVVGAAGVTFFAFLGGEPRFIASLSRVRV
jgi:hypothetical protein